MKPYLIAARLQFDALALAFTMRMLGLIVLALLPHRLQGGRKLALGMLNIARARRHWSTLPAARVYVAKWRARTLKSLTSGRTWEVENALFDEGARAMKRRDKRRRKPQENTDESVLAWYHSRGERKPTELELLRRRVRQLTYSEIRRHIRRLDLRDGIGV